MKKSKYIFSILFLMVLNFNCFSQLSCYKIVLDPGHGGSQNGAKCVNGEYEKNLNLAISLKLRTILQNRGATVVMTRETDKQLVVTGEEPRLDVEARMNFINNENPDAAISVHLNGSRLGVLKQGTTVLWYNGEASLKFAEKVYPRLVIAIDYPGLNVEKDDGPAVLKTNPTIPTIITESLYITEPNGCAFINSSLNQTHVAEAHADGIQDYLGSCNTNTPGNDDCSGLDDKFELTSNGSCTIGTVKGATSSYLPNKCDGCKCTSDDDYDVYYKFKATATSHTVTVSNYAKNFDAVIEIRTACASGTSNYLSCYDEPGIPTSVSHTWDNLKIGNTYYIRVYEYNYVSSPPSSPEFEICVTHSSSCPTQGAPVSNAASNLEQTGFQANWNTASGASGYILDVSTTSNFSSYVSGYNNLDVGNTTSKNVIGLNCGSTYYYRVRAYNSCGNTSTNSSDISAITSTCTSCTAPAITLHPSSQSKTAPESASFSITASGSNNQYQWEYNTGSSWGNVPNSSSYSGVNTTMLNINSTAIEMNGYQYRCYVTSSCTTSSDRSNTATLKVSSGNSGCNYSLSKTAQNFDYTGGSGSFTINATAGAGCKWNVSVSPNSEYDIANFTITNGAGPYTITYTVEPNPTTHSLNSIYSITGNDGYSQDYVITQDANTTCDASFSSSSASFNSSGGTGTFNIDIGAGCFWNITNSCSSMITNLNPTDGYGPASVTYKVLTYADLTTRSCKIRIQQNNKSYTITQQGICFAPNTQATAITFSSVSTNLMIASWTNGNGSRRIVKVNTSNSFTAPANGTDPSANSSYSGSGEQVVYNGSGNSVTVSGLSLNTTYWYRVYEANCTGTSSLYYTETASNNPISQNTTTSCTAPVSPTSATASQTKITSGQSTTLQVNEGALNSASNWEWYSDNCEGTQVGTGATLLVSPTKTTTYYVQASACGITTVCRSVTITVNPVNNPLTYVPDDNFEQALIDFGYDDIIDDYVLTSNIEVVKTLILNERNIYDLTGLEDFRALIHLECKKNHISNINLTENTALEFFYCWDNLLTTLDVTKNIALETLRCNKNHLTNLDVSNNLSIITLECSQNELSSLDVSNNTKLVWINCSYNKLSEIDLKLNTNIETLWCSSNLLIYLDISLNNSLTDLSCSQNQLKSLNLRNGNNNNFKSVFADNNPNLRCIEVDDVAFAEGSTWIKDITANYSEDCSCIEPEITSQPLSATITEGEIASFNVLSTGSDDKYRWMMTSGWTNYDVPNSPPYSGINSNTLIINSTALSMDGYKYWCIVSSSCTTKTVTSNNATLNVKKVNDENIIKDADGNSYTTVTIGSQVWMGQNLKTTKYNDGTAIPMVTGNNTWAVLTTPAYCWYNNDIGYKNPYGALYNWFAVNTGKLCPLGWHVPSDNEWDILTDYLGGIEIAGGKMKESGTTNWIPPNNGATNSSGFTALPGGWSDKLGSFSFFGQAGFWWSTTETIITDAWIRGLITDFGNVGWTSNFSKKYGLSIRCLCDIPVSSKIISTVDLIKVYPNPTTGIITIEGLQENEKTEIALYNMNSKLLKVQISYSSLTQMDISDVVSGIYLLVIDNRFEQAVKIIKR